MGDDPRTAGGRGRTDPPHSVTAPPAGARQRLNDQLLAVALEAAAEAVDLIHTNRPIELSIEAKSSATDHVTQMDRASESLIRSIIVRHRPDDRIVGEEDGDSGSGDSGVTWYVDPIDGTTNYVYDHPGYAVSIAAVVDGVGTIGVRRGSDARSHVPGGAGRDRVMRRQIVAARRSPVGRGRVGRHRVRLRRRTSGPTGRGRRAVAAPGSRHPSHGRGRGRPVFGRLRTGRRVLRGGAVGLGPRGRCCHRGGGRGSTRCTRRRPGPAGIGARRTPGSLRAPARPPPGTGRGRRASRAAGSPPRRSKSG